MIWNNKFSQAANHSTPITSIYIPLSNAMTINVPAKQLDTNPTDVHRPSYDSIIVRGILLLYSIMEGPGILMISQMFQDLIHSCAKIILRLKNPGYKTKRVIS